MKKSIDINDCAKTLCMSEYEFQRIFAFIVGTPISEYIRKRRLVEAGREIAETKKNIGDIAFDYQYHNHSSFSRAFKEFHNYSPQEIRKSGGKWLTKFEPFILKEENKLDFKVIELPKTFMARSGNKSLKEFDKWWSKKYQESNSLFPRDFMWNNEKTGKLEWLYSLDGNEKDTNGYETFIFPGGLYATITADDNAKAKSKAYYELKRRVDSSDQYCIANEENDIYYHQRYPMGHVSTPNGFKKHQFTIFVPIVLK